VRRGCQRVGGRDRHATRFEMGGRGYRARLIYVPMPNHFSPGTESMIGRLPPAPRHLSKAARDLFTSISRSFVMEQHDLAVLVKALEAWDRADQARTRIDTDGLMVTSRLGEPKPHPLLAIERDSRTAFLAGMRQLNLDYEPVLPHAQTAAARSARWRNSA